jgi:hypothetical protein
VGQGVGVIFLQVINKYFAPGKWVLPNVTTRKNLQFLSDCVSDKPASLSMAIFFSVLAVSYPKLLNCTVHAGQKTKGGSERRGTKM